MTGLTVIEYPALFLALAAVLAVVGRWAVKVYRFAKNLDETVHYIRHEMELNGGRTMRDAVARIERKVNDIETHRLRDIEQALADVRDDAG